MHAYRTHTCAQLTAADAGTDVRLSGWVHNKRDHGGVLFVDLRDHYGVTQVVADSDSPALEVLEKVRLESVITIDGTVKKRADAAVNPNLPTGAIEVFAKAATVQSVAADLPLIVNSAEDYPEGNAPQVPLRRPSARAVAPQHRAALQRDLIDPSPHDREGLHRVSDPDPRCVQPRRRARLSRPQPPPSGPLLRAPAGAADVQAAADGGRLSTAISRSRPVSATRTCAPIAAPNSTSSISK